MTDRLQQKAEDLVREKFCISREATSEWVRRRYTLEVIITKDALTAGIAMAAEELRELSNKAAPGPWHSMRDGNQFIETRYFPTAKGVAASRIEEVTRPWNPHALLAFGFKPEEYETARFLDADADFIVACVNYVREALAKGETQHG